MNRSLRGRDRRTKPPLPKRPYRDTAILHAVLALVICGLALLTGGDLGTAAIVAALYFLIATAWSWWRFTRRIRGGTREPGARSSDGGGTL